MVEVDMIFQRQWSIVDLWSFW